jgi:lipoate-protein ligase A
VIFERLLFFDDQKPNDGALNMAVDEVLLQTANAPILRIYRWRHPTISFGYFEAYKNVQRAHAGLAHVRRWTGGGIVSHGADLTYSLIVPRSAQFAWERPSEIYRKVHATIVSVMNERGVTALLAGENGERGLDCFTSPVAHDVILNGRKIAGAAQRRSRLGLLHQGSIRHDSIDLHFGERIARGLANEVREIACSTEQLAAAESLARAKYSSDAWTRKY